MTRNRLQNFGTEMFAAIDAGDIDSYVKFLSADLRFQFANAEPISRRGAVAVSPQSRGAAQDRPGMAQRGTIIQEIETTYTRLDGGKVTLPAATILGMDSDTVADCRIYTDLAPVYA